jgi:hypothetical protein
LILVENFRQIETVEPASTILHAKQPDDAALWDLIDALRNAGIDLIEIRREGHARVVMPCTSCPKCLAAARTPPCAESQQTAAADPTVRDTIHSADLGRVVREDQQPGFSDQDVLAPSSFRIRRRRR